MAVAPQERTSSVGARYRTDFAVRFRTSISQAILALTKKIAGALLSRQVGQKALPAQ